MFTTKIFITTCLCLLSFLSHGENLHIAVASNFSQTMKQLVVAFEKKSAHQVNVSFASSGKIYAQIKHGAPFDVFFSADRDKPLMLEGEGLVVKGSRFTYALGQLVLWARQVDPSLSVEQRLMQGDFDKLAIANARLAPYGLAAQQTIDSLGLSELTKSKIVKGENIMQTLHFIRSGNAQLGFVALSQLSMIKDLSTSSFWLVPPHLYQEIRQDVVWLKKAEKNHAAAEFMAFVGQQEALSIIRNSGYRIPNADKVDNNL